MMRFTTVLALGAIFIPLIPSVAIAQQEGDERPSPSADSFQGGREGSVPVDPWWESFGDAQLVELVDEALAGNHDVAAALARVRAAEEQVTRTAAPLWPSLSLDGTLGGQPSDALGFQFGGVSSMGGGADIPGVETPAAPEMPAVVLSTSVMLNLRYQFDLWGQTTNAYRASQLLRDASRGDSDALAALTTIQIGIAYYDAVAAQQQIGIVQEQIELNESLVELLQLRFENNQAAAAEVLQQRQQLASARARLPGARAARRTARQRLNVFLGRAPSTPITTAETLPSLPAVPATGDPEDLFAHRPDLRAARDRLEAARRQERSLVRAMLPVLGVSGNAGYQGFNSTEYNDMGTWGFAVTVSVPAFRGFGDHAAIREARANIDAARHTLEQGVLQATADVESALSLETEAREQVEAHRAMLEAAQQAFDVSRDSYVAGVGNYLAVLVAVGTLQAAQLTMVQSERALINSRLQLYQSLGGQWTEGLARSGRRGEP